MKTVIQVENFWKSFSGKVIHSGVNFSVYQGECLGLLGGSGAGKSVILRSLIGLEKPDKGRIVISGEDISNKRERELVHVRRHVAYVFQGGALFDSMDVYDNLAYPLREHTDLSETEISKKIVSLLDEFGMKGTQKVYPAELSGGMQKRIGLARAIILEPDIVLYDEPTAGLDPFNTKKIQEMVLRLKQRGVTSILVTHDIPSAMAVCDRLAFLQHGEIQAIGSIQDLENDPNHLLLRFSRGDIV